MTQENSKEPLKVGLMVGREWSWPPAFIEKVNNMNAGVVVEYVKIGGSKMDEPCEYKVIIDRISHEIPYYRSYLKNAVVQGTIVINNPFWWTADDKYIESTIAHRLGVAHPRTAVLPNHSYIEGIVTESLRNLEYPLPWEDLLNYTGTPAFLKPAIGGGWKNVYKVHNLEELWAAYNETGELTMVLQQGINFEQYVRCFCLGRKDVLIMRYDPGERKYHNDPNYLSPALAKRIEQDCLKLCEALSYDMNTLEFAIEDGIPYAIDFLNPAPDFDINSLGQDHFNWVQEKMAALVIGYATGKTKPQKVDYRWDSLMKGNS
ncbi:MAG: hypothetical protein J0I20_04670 [Chloroflexi bacterium]|nr:hypothetical protein [Chloroflexota bacterium]OJW04389.1 MAG: glutathione synthase [Chloroflexi bacterium 54-19]